MAHHGEEFDPEMVDHLKQLFESARDSENEYLKRLSSRFEEKLGATGQFPEGKLTKMDEGEIRFAVFQKDGGIVLDFGCQVTWLGMTPKQACELGNLLIKHGRQAAERG